MDDRQANTSSASDREHLDVVLAQLAEDARLYDLAVESFNAHLENHLDRRDLHDLSYRTPITEHEAYEAARSGDRVAIEAVLEDLFEQQTLDSAVRRHPRIYPIHEEAVEHLEIARRRVVRTLESALQFLETDER